MNVQVGPTWKEERWWKVCNNPWYGTRI